MQLSNHLISPEADDSLIDAPTPDKWSAEETKEFLRLREIEPTKRSAVVVTMRDDGISILEWVAHYLALGFEGIFIYSNDNADQSDQLLRLLAEHGTITYIENRTTGKVSPQRKAFEHSIRRLPALRQFNWVFYADSDEFLELPMHGHRIDAAIAELEQRFPEKRPSAVLYYWKWFVSGYLYERSAVPLISRFSFARPHGLFKSLVKLHDVASMQRLHFPDLWEANFMVDARFEPLPNSETPEKIWELVNAPQYYGHGQIRHYWCKSFQEFAVKKRRGDMLSMSANAYSRGFEQFFEWNDAEDSALYEPIDPLFLHAVQRELANLRALPGVSELEQQIVLNFPKLLDSFGGDAGLREIYNANLHKFGLVKND